MFCAKPAPSSRGSSLVFVEFNMARLQRGYSEPRGEKELRGEMSDQSDDEGPEEITFDESKAVALKSVKDARDSVKRYTDLGLASLSESLLTASTVHYSAHGQYIQSL